MAKFIPIPAVLARMSISAIRMLKTDRFFSTSQKHGPLGMGEFGLVLHSFMDYFDYPTILLCGRIVDVLDQINNHGRPMEEYCFWPDVLDGLKEMFTRTQFAVDQGGYFPEIKVSCRLILDGLKAIMLDLIHVTFDLLRGHLSLGDKFNSTVKIR